MNFPKEIIVNSINIHKYKSNNKNSVNNKDRGLKRLRLYIVDNKLHLFRARSTGYNTIDIKNGVSFYGTSIYDLKSYNTSLSRKKFYEMVLTSKSNLNDIIVDLNLSKNSRIIVDYFNKNVDTGNNKDENINLLNTLFIGKTLEKSGKLPKGTIVARDSDDIEDDLEMVKILKKLFPGKIGSFTSGSNGLKHNEVIIWDPKINKRIAKTNSSTKNSKKNRSPKSPNGPGSRLSFGSPTSPNKRKRKIGTKSKRGNINNINRGNNNFNINRGNNNINRETKTKFKKLGITLSRHTNL